MSHVKDNYMCEKHNSTYGYKDAEGKWNCWACYREDRYQNPKGEQITTYTSKGVEARVILEGTHSVVLEVWNIENPKDRRMIDSLPYNYLSQAMREWRNIVQRIEDGEISVKSKTINPDERERGRRTSPVPELRISAGSAYISGTSR